MQIIIDVGNTKTKVALLDKGKWTVHTMPLADLTIQELQSIISNNGDPESAIIASVSHYDPRIDELLQEKCKLLKFDKTLRMPVGINYKTPATLGNDRLANACALFDRYSGTPALAIDCGTCIKFDVIDNTGKYLGGSIGPGLVMRFKALSHFTAQLPELSVDPEIALIGDSTVNSIQSGVFNGVISEIDGMINQYEHLFKGIKKVITGGDAELLAGKLKSSIFVAPNLTLHGLKVILDHNL